jgi:hypothetical protein
MRFVKVQRTDDAGENRLGTIRLWIEAVPGVRAARRLDWALVLFDDHVTLRSVDSNRLVTRVAAAPTETRLLAMLQQRGIDIGQYRPGATFAIDIHITDAEALALGVS